jgi:hypothetical protein
VPADDRLYIRVDQGLPRHPKIAGLSDAAFRTLVTLWCYCSEQVTDGVVGAAIMARFPKRAVLELLDAGLLEHPGNRDTLKTTPLRNTGEWYCHDYTYHQRTAAEIATIKGKRGSAGSLGAHHRWHVKRGKYDPGCPHCLAR